MELSISQLAAAIGEFSPDLACGIIRKIDQPGAKTILFEVELYRKRRRLLFSAHPRFSRCHLVQQQQFVKAKTPPNFCQLLRAHLRHKRVESITQLEGDRIIQLTAAWSKGDRIRVVFVAELTGLLSNFFLLNETGHILGWLNPPQASRRLSQGSLYSPPPIIQKSGFRETAIPLLDPGQYPLNHSFETYFAELEKTDDENRLKKEVLAQFEGGIRQLKKRLSRLTASHAEATKSSKYQQHGEFLKCRLHEIRAGADHFSYTGPSLDAAEALEKETVVPLDPALSPAENMARFFKRYKKGVAGLANLKPLIEATRARLIQLEAGKGAVLENRPADASDLPPNTPRRTHPGQTKKKGPPVYLSSDKLRIVAGRNDRENEHITFGMARGNDLWLHARGASGAHVLIQMAGRREAPHQTLLEAATLALHFSRCKKEGKGEVMYTFKKYLQRPRKGKPGSVLCTQEKTIYLEIAADRLSQILQNRIEETPEA